MQLVFNLCIYIFIFFCRCFVLTNFGYKYIFQNSAAPIWSPTSKKSLDDPLPPAPEDLPSPPPLIAPASSVKDFNKPVTKGFRSVSRPVVKVQDTSSSFVSLHEISIFMTILRFYWLLHIYM